MNMYLRDIRVAHLFVQDVSIVLNCKLLRKRDPPQGLLKTLSRPQTVYEDSEYISTSSCSSALAPVQQRNEVGRYEAVTSKAQEGINSSGPKDAVETESGPLGEEKSPSTSREEEERRDEDQEERRGME
ncbi:unnamed protein product [Pleuronectes platessa]|uniref:Uncharacterized protein n=1 Tax=Pleuronectes platessa TaxID=8262 RepID=A0A9N7U6N4_PLEPL|nr:unnamed protein product [Pleuronectes platessa]